MSEDQVDGRVFRLTDDLARQQRTRAEYAEQERDLFQRENHRLLVEAMALRARVATLEAAFRDIYEAAKLDMPDEGKHELAVRIMRMADPVTPTATRPGVTNE